MNDEREIPRGVVHRRRSAWAFIRVSSLTAAHLRLDGTTGAAARLEMLHRLEDAYDELRFSPEHSSGVGALDPEGIMVAVYYAPGDPRNTAVDYASYCLQHNIVARYRLVPAGRDSGPANELSPNAYLPAAARGRDIP